MTNSTTLDQRELTMGRVPSYVSCSAASRRRPRAATSLDWSPTLGSLATAEDLARYAIALENGTRCRPRARRDVVSPAGSLPEGPREWRT